MICSLYILHIPQNFQQRVNCQDILTGWEWENIRNRSNLYFKSPTYFLYFLISILSKCLDSSRVAEIFSWQSKNKSPAKADNSSNILWWLLLLLYFVVGGSYRCVTDGLWLGTQTFHALLDSLQGTIHILQLREY